MAEFKRDRYKIILVDGKPQLSEVALGEVIKEATDRLVPDDGGLISARGEAIATIKDGVVLDRGQDGKIINLVHKEVWAGATAGKPSDYIDVIYLAD